MLVILHPTANGTVLAHVTLRGYQNQQEVRNAVIGGRQVDHLRLWIDDRPIEASIEGFTNPNTGGISNAEVTRWLIDNYLTENENELLFDVIYDEADHSFNYHFRGIVSRYNVIAL